MKKLLTLAMAICMLFAFTACGGKDSYSKVSDEDRLLIMTNFDIWMNEGANWDTYKMNVNMDGVKATICYSKAAGKEGLYYKATIEDVIMEMSFTEGRAYINMGGLKTSMEMSLPEFEDYIEILGADLNMMSMIEFDASEFASATVSATATEGARTIKFYEKDKDGWGELLLKIDAEEKLVGIDFSAKSSYGGQSYKISASLEKIDEIPFPSGLNTTNYPNAGI